MNNYNFYLKKTQLDTLIQSLLCIGINCFIYLTITRDSQTRRSLYLGIPYLIKKKTKKISNHKGPVK